MHDVGRFLNRILGLPPDIQNRSEICQLKNNFLIVIRVGLNMLTSSKNTGCLSVLLAFWILLSIMHALKGILTLGLLI